MPVAPIRTDPPGRYVIIYDGHCRFCTAGARKLLAWMGKVDVELVDFHAPGVLGRFPGLTHDVCMERMHLVDPTGRIFAGAEGIVRAISTGGFLGQLALIYYVPGLRQLLDGVYRLIATHRYRLMGRAIAARECAVGTCSLHLRKQLSSPKH